MHQTGNDGRGAHQLASLSEIIEDIAGELALEPLLARLADRARTLSGAEVALIGLLDAEADVIRTAACSGHPARSLYAEVPRGEGLAGLVLERDTAILSRYGDLPRPLDAERPDRTVLGVPVRDKTTLIGVFCLGSDDPGHLGPDAQTLLEHLARHAGVAIVNARRFGHERARADRLMLVARVAGVMSATQDLSALFQATEAAVREMLGEAAISVSVFDETQQAGLRVCAGLDAPPDEVQGSRVAGHGAPKSAFCHVPAPAEGARHVTSAPIVYDQQRLGSLVVESGAPLDAADLASLHVMSENLAAAIVNVRLRERLRSGAILEQRQKLARDLHEKVTQVLQDMDVITRTLPDAYDRHPEAAARLATQLGALSQQAFSELRALMLELAPSQPTGAVPSPVRATASPSQPLAAGAHIERGRPVHGQP